MKVSRDELPLKNNMAKEESASLLRRHNVTVNSRLCNAMRKLMCSAFPPETQVNFP